jgi:glycerol-3-phosphate O-acyltransferase
MTAKLNNKPASIVRWVSELDAAIVPVVVTYDRVIEVRNVVSKLTQNQLAQRSLFKYIKKLNNKPKDHYGEVYIKYLEPATLQEPSDILIHLTKV